MESLILDKTGIGIEQEAWIVDAYGKPVTIINGKPAYLALRDTLEQQTGQEPTYLSAELLSCQAEVKTLELHSSPKDALREIREHLNTVNSVLSSLGNGLQLETEAYKDMRGIDLIAADPDAPSYRRVLEWSATDSGCELLRKTAICSMQLCVSSGLDNMAEISKLELLARCYDYLSGNYQGIQELNNFSPRLGIIEDLIISVKRDNFNQLRLLEQSNRKDTWITRPDNLSVSDLIQWYLAHSGVETVSEMDSKDAHGLLLKGKMRKGTLDLVCMEHRWADACENLDLVASKINDMHNRMMDTCI